MQLSINNFFTSVTIKKNVLWSLIFCLLVVFIVTFAFNIVTPAQPFIFNSITINVGFYECVNSDLNQIYFSAAGYACVILLSIFIVALTAWAIYIQTDKYIQLLYKNWLINLTICFYWIIYMMYMIYIFHNHFSINIIQYQMLNLIYNFKLLDMSNKLIDINLSSFGIAFIILNVFYLLIQLFFTFKLLVRGKHV